MLLALDDTAEKSGEFSNIKLANDGRVSTAQRFLNCSTTANFSDYLGSPTVGRPRRSTELEPLQKAHDPPMRCFRCLCRRLWLRRWNPGHSRPERSLAPDARLHYSCDQPQRHHVRRIWDCLDAALQLLGSSPRALLDIAHGPPLHARVRAVNLV